jgi:hypothetical protein
MFTVVMRLVCLQKQDIDIFQQTIVRSCCFRLWIGLMIELPAFGCVLCDYVSCVEIYTLPT